VADVGATDAGVVFFGADVARGVAGGAVSGGAVVAGGAGGAVGSGAAVVGGGDTGGSVPTTPVRPPVGTTGTVASVVCVLTASCFS
jgi:hypothetical protein